MHRVMSTLSRLGVALCRRLGFKHNMSNIELLSDELH